MAQAFRVRGFSPANGRLVELIVVAASASEAKRQVEESGLRHVIATPLPDSGPNDPGSRGGGGLSKAPPKPSRSSDDPAATSNPFAALARLAGLTARFTC